MTPNQIEKIASEVKRINGQIINEIDEFTDFEEKTIILISAMSRVLAELIIIEVLDEETREEMKKVMCDFVGKNIELALDQEINKVSGQMSLEIN